MRMGGPKHAAVLSVPGFKELQEGTRRTTDLNIISTQQFTRQKDLSERGMVHRPVFHPFVEMMVHIPGSSYPRGGEGGGLVSAAG